MKVMVIVKASRACEAGEMPSQQLLAEMGKFNEELARAGILLAGEGLQPSSKGVRVRFDGKERSVTDGPFPETKELIGGYWLWNVKSMSEAIDWIKRCPNPHEGTCEIEIRPVQGPGEIGCGFTPELREREASTFAQTLGLGAVRYENGRPLVLAGLSGAFDESTTKNIPDLWVRFATHLGKVPGQVGATSYGVCYNVKSDCAFDYLAGVEVADSAKVPPDLTRLSLPAARYAVVTHTGHISSIQQTLDKVWSRWIPGAAIKPAHAPCFERYTEKYDPKSGNGDVEIWIPLQA